MTPRVRRGRKAVIESTLRDLRRPQSLENGRLVTAPKSARHLSLRGVDLCGADLRWADLSYCDLRGADLSGSWLGGADLSWANLSGARLAEADFRRTLLVEAVLDRADLSDADLTTATGLTWATVHNVRGGRSIRWPPGFDPRPPLVTGPAPRR